MLRDRHLTQGFDSSHFTLAAAHDRQACDTRLAAKEARLRFLLSGSESWLALCRFRRSARANALLQTSQRKRFPSVSEDLVSTILQTLEKSRVGEWRGLS
jgi:hypothetical protein